jgi:MraZ protein
VAGPEVLSPVLYGGFPVKVDEKGRVKLPSSIRRACAERYGEGPFFITSLNGHCANVYPGRAWEEIMGKIAGVPASQPAVAKLRRYTSYFGQMVTMDPQGRVLIPSLLRDKAQLKDQAIVLGQKDHMEIWNLERFQQSMDADPITTEDQDFFSTLGL